MPASETKTLPPAPSDKPGGKDQAATRLPYEIHVTVDPEATPELKVKHFIASCRRLGIRAIVLDLGIHVCGDLSDYMTSSSAMYETDAEAHAETDRIADGLAADGFHVIRKKIEAAPWHHMAPQTEGDPMPPHGYFESHLAIQCHEDRIPDLRAGIGETSDILPLYISRNTFKSVENGEVIIMATLRDYANPFDIYSQRILLAQARVAQLGFELGKRIITEFAFYDTNTAQDDQWMQKREKAA